MGDRVLNISLPKIGEKSLFTKDLEDALRNGGVDFIVHSLKDLPTSLPSGLAIGAVLERHDPRDALLLNEKHKGATLATLPPGSIIGTSSLRRTAQIMRFYPHLVVNDVRGNLNTRLAKLDAPTSKYSGLILAKAGVERMETIAEGWKDRIDQVLEPEDIMYAVGQGALAVECRANDAYILEMLERITSYEAECEILAERSFLKTLGGGCSAPVAVRTVLKPTTGNDDKLDLEISGGVWSLDGKEQLLDVVSKNLGVVRKRRHSECIVGGGGEAASEEDSGDSSDAVTSAKHMKLDVEKSDEENSTDSGELRERRKSPLVIDETKIEFEEDGEKKPLDIQALINIHGDLFKKCPFSSQLKAMAGIAEEKISSGGAPTISCTGGSSSSCELQGIGQDVMGECPVLSTIEKVELLNSAEGDEKKGEIVTKKCPVTGHGPKSDVNGNGTVAAAACCPYSNKRSTTTTNTAGFPALLETNGVESCPFISSIKMVDCDENKNFIDVPNAHPEVETEASGDSVKLYCGLICHKTIDPQVLASCELLGKQLAEKLIGQGALDVMKVAQNIIHSKIG